MCNVRVCQDPLNERSGAWGPSLRMYVVVCSCYVCSLVRVCVGRRKCGGGGGVCYVSVGGEVGWLWYGMFCVFVVCCDTFLFSFLRYVIGVCSGILKNTPNKHNTRNNAHTSCTTHATTHTQDTVPHKPQNCPSSIAQTPQKKHNRPQKPQHTTNTTNTTENQKKKTQKQKPTTQKPQLNKNKPQHSIPNARVFAIAPQATRVSRELVTHERMCR